MEYFQIYFGGNIYQIADDLEANIQKDFDQHPELNLSVRKIDVKGTKVSISINRKVDQSYYEANEGYIVWNDACIFTGNIEEEYVRGNIRLPNETCCSLFNHCFPINVLVKDYNHIVKEKNWVLSLNCVTHENYFTIEYEFIK